MRGIQTHIFFTLSFSLFTMLTFGQPLKAGFSDSIYINVFSGTPEGKLHISVKESMIYIRGEVFDKEALIRFRKGDSTVNYEDILIKRETKIVSDSLANQLRDKVNEFLLTENWSKTISTNAVKETSSYNLNVQIWVSSHQLLIERGFYPVIGKTKYLWSKEFSDFNFYLLKLHSYLN